VILADWVPLNFKKYYLLFELEIREMDRPIDQGDQQPSAGTRPALLGLPHELVNV
jgi:hypothetical protein